MVGSHAEGKVAQLEDGEVVGHYAGESEPELRGLRDDQVQPLAGVLSAENQRRRVRGRRRGLVTDGPEYR